MSRNPGCNKQPNKCGCPTPPSNPCGQSKPSSKNGCSQARAAPCKNESKEDECPKPKCPCPRVQPQKPSRCSEAREQIKNMCNNGLLQNQAPTFGGCGQPKTSSDCDNLNGKQPVSKYLEAISDIVATVIEILCICGVHYCKAKKATNTLINAFIKFDEIPQENCKDLKKKIRKGEFYSNLASETAMTGTETLQTYAVAKYAFKAFYYKQSAVFYNPSFIDECKWHRAAEKTFMAFSKFNNGLSCSHIDKVENLIKSTYDDYIERFRQRCQCDCQANSSNQHSHCPKTCQTCQKKIQPSCSAPPTNKCFSEPPKPKCKCCKPKKRNCPKI